MRSEMFWMMMMMAVVPIVLTQRLSYEPDESVIQLTEPHVGFKLRCLVNYTNADGEETNKEEVKIEWSYLETNKSEGLDEVGVDEKYIFVDEETGRSSVGMSEKNVRPGRYTCKAKIKGIKELTQSWDIYMFKVQQLDKSKTFIVGDDVKLKCKLKPFSDMDGEVDFKWYTVPEETPEAAGTLLQNSATQREEIDPHIRIGRPQPNMTVLKIEDAVYGDRSIYRCVAEIKKSDGTRMTSQTQILTRIKDKYSALYPFIGIVIEVIVLALIIFICEKRKTSEGLDEDEDEYNGGVTAGNGNSNLRHRRT